MAIQMLEESLNRLQTDHLDLWQIPGVFFENDPQLFIRPGGAAEALLEAKNREGTICWIYWAQGPRDSFTDAAAEFSVRYRADAAERV